MIKKYPFVKQEEVKDCAAACLSMIISYYNGYLDMDKIRNLLKTNQKGTTAYNIVEGAKKIGFEAKGVKCNLEDINEDNIVLPCIANVIINNSYCHFIVIYKIDFVKNTILIADPANKIMKMSFDIFKSIFSGIIIMLYPNDNIPCESKINVKKQLFINTIKSHPKLIKQVSILSFFITIFSIFSSFFLESISNAITKYQSKEIVILVLFIFLIINFLRVLSDYFRQKILILLNEKINLKLTMDTYKKTLLLPYKNYRQKTTGDIVTRILDISLIKDNISKIFLILIVDLPLTLCALVFLYMINDKLCILSIIILILYTIIIFIFKDYFDNSIKNIKQNYAEATSYMMESINNFETVKGLKIENSIYNQFEKKYVSLLNKIYKNNNMLNLQNILKLFINDMGIILIYGIGALLVLKEQISFGSLLSFGALLTYFFEPLKNIISLEKDIRELDLVINRMFSIYNNSINNGISKDIYHGDIKFCNLNYTYDDQNEVLKNINLTINSGDKVLILGQSGSGKSTLLKILMKYYEIDRGMIYINNVDINDYEGAKGIIYISQSENLFTDTLYNNITLYDNINIKKILDVSNLCNLEDIIHKNALGYQMFIEENGFNLSGGEKQRIVLARSLLKKFNILVIDEGLNQMDVNLERKILKQLFEKYKNKTIIVISHRIDNLDLYNRKVVLEKGVLKENVSKVESY